MNFRITQLLEITYAKIVVGTVIGVIGLAGGIKVGYALIQADSHHVAWTQEPITEEMMLRLNPAIQIGASFPPESYLDSNGSTGSLYDLFSRKRTLLIILRNNDQFSKISDIRVVIDNMQEDHSQVILCTDFQDDTDWAFTTDTLGIDLRIGCDIDPESNWTWQWAASVCSGFARHGT